jgi:hypothetical protein
MTTVVALPRECTMAQNFVARDTAGKLGKCSPVNDTKAVYCEHLNNLAGYARKDVHARKIGKRYEPVRGPITCDELERHARGLLRMRTERPVPLECFKYGDYGVDGGKCQPC